MADLLTHCYFLCQYPIELQMLKPYAPPGIRMKVPSIHGIYANPMTRSNAVEILKFGWETIVGSPEPGVYGNLREPKRESL